MARWAAAAPARAARPHAGIDGDDAALVGEHGVEIDLAHLRQISGKLRELDQEQRDGVDVRGRHVAVSLQHAGDPGASDQVAGQREIERRQRQRLVGDDLDRGAAAAKYDDRAEGRIVRNSGDQLARVRAHDHRMERHAGDARIRSRGPRPREDIGDGLAHRRLVGEVEPYAAHLRFVNDIRRKDFGHHAQSLRQPGARGGGGFVGIAGQERGDESEWNRPRAGRVISIGSSHVRPRCTAFATTARAVVRSGLKSCGRLGGVAIKASCASR